MQFTRVPTRIKYNNTHHTRCADIRLRLDVLTKYTHSLAGRRHNYIHTHTRVRITRPVYNFLLIFWYARTFAIKLYLWVFAKIYVYFVEKALTSAVAVFLQTLQVITLIICHASLQYRVLYFRWISVRLILQRELVYCYYDNMTIIKNDWCRFFEFDVRLVRSSEIRIACVVFGIVSTRIQNIIMCVWLHFFTLPFLRVDAFKLFTTSTRSKFVNSSFLQKHYTRFDDLCLSFYIKYIEFPRFSQMYFQYKYCSTWHNFTK